MMLLHSALNWISSALLLPVMLLLLVGLLVSLLRLAGLFRMGLRRPAFRARLQNALKNTPDALDDAALLRPSLRNGLQQLLAFPAEAERERVLAEFACASQKELEMCRILNRVGPMLGLMGTLIPMGPALTALSAGDLATMATNLQVAFATTVVGIVVGGAGFLEQTVLQRWHAEEMVALETLAAKRDPGA